jgi:hypothetical protein
VPENARTRNRNPEKFFFAGNGEGQEIKLHVATGL